MFLVFAALLRPSAVLAGETLSLPESWVDIAAPWRRSPGLPSKINPPNQVLGAIDSVRQASGS